MPTTRGRIRPYASKGELEAYLAYHREMLLRLIKGLVAVLIKEDKEGFYFELQVSERLGDQRGMSLEDAIPAFAWENPRRVRARVVVVHLKTPKL